MVDQVVSSIGQWLIKGIRDSIIPIILSAGISLLANKSFIQRSQEKRRHSIILNNESFKEWRSRLNEICYIGTHISLAEYSHEEKKIVPIELKELNVIPHHKYLESHMKTGYAQEWKSWEKLRTITHKYYEERANFLEEIRQKIVVDSKHLTLLEHYHRPGTKEPREYYRPDKMAVQISNELERRLSGMDNWIQGEPGISVVHHGDILYHQLSIGRESYMITDTNQENVEFFIDLAFKYVKDQNTILKTKELSVLKKQMYEKRDEFQSKLDDIISKIELGHNAKGKCDVC